MKQFSLPFVVLSFSLLMAACGKEEKKIETNQRGVPLTVADVIMGDSYTIDTLYCSPERLAVYIDNPDYTQHLIYIDDAIVANDPNLQVDSITGDVYDVSDQLRDVRVNFSNVESVDRFRAAFPQYPEFSTVVVGDTASTGQSSIFAYAVSVPGDKVSHAPDVLRWVESCIDDSLRYNPNIKAFGQQIQRQFFADWSVKESDMTYSKSRSMLVYDMTKSYVTYHDYFWGFLGGAHGMYGDRYVSYSLVDNCPVTYEYLFKPDCETEVRELIYEALAADEDFMTNHKITSVSQARSYIQRYLMGDQLPLPDPGLLPQGVVFCYQPYEIACYADGQFVLVVPYSKIRPYLAVNIN